MNKTVQDLKMEVAIIKKKSQMEATLEMKNLKNRRAETTGTRTTNGIQEMGERILGIEGIIDIDKSIKELPSVHNFLNKNIGESSLT